MYIFFVISTQVQPYQDPTVFSSRQNFPIKSIPSWKIITYSWRGFSPLEINMIFIFFWYDLLFFSFFEGASSEMLKYRLGYVQDHGVSKSGDVKKIEFEDV